MPTFASVPHHRYLLSRLQREWDRLRSSPGALRRARQWGIDGVAIDSLDDLLAASGLGRIGHTAADGAVLRELVILARTDPLAARVVLQRLLPGLSSAARRHSSTFGQGIEALDELVGAAWTVIRTFDVDRVRGYLVVSLLRSCTYHAFEAGRRRTLVLEHADPLLMGHHVVGGIDPGTALDDLGVADARALLDPRCHIAAVVEVARRRGLADADAELVTLLLASPVEEIAGALQVSTRTVRNHRARIMRDLRNAVAPCP